MKNKEEQDWLYDISKTLPVSKDTVEDWYNRVGNKEEFLKLCLIYRQCGKSSLFTEFQKLKDRYKK